MIDETMSNLLNCDKRIFEGKGFFEAPSIKPFDMDIEGATCIPFYEALREKEPENKICHFYTDDYMFDRVWKRPEKYLDVLRRFKAVLSPDFSMYTDFPRAVCIFNHFRKQWCGAYWQEHGINVISTVGWVNEDSYEYCYDGLPRNSLVCISTVGSFSKKEYREIWHTGYKHSLEVLKPKKIIFYGKMYPEIEVPSGIEYAVMANQQMQRLSAIRDERRRIAREEREKAKLMLAK